MPIAAISLMRRRDDVDLNAFRRHWLDVHGPLVCQFPGLRHYAQCHVVASPATNAPAQAMRIDGFPILAFDSDADRMLAHNSAAMTACNEDSKQFIGAVARIITAQEDVVPADEQAGRMRLIVLYPEGMNLAAFENLPAAETLRETLSAAETLRAIERSIDQMRTLPRLRGLRRYRVLQQGRAPNSTIPHLQVNAAAMAQAWFDSLIDLECAASCCVAPGVALFAAEEHRLQ
jgi:uncharacterized protein (TIGR02118 family)